jgi:transcriptional regulator with GAF, ATPase, and Fis domain
MVSEGAFREDLWYRLAVFPIVLPPLRERQGDIPELARHFAQRAATRFVLPESMPSPEDIQLLKEYAWPGNIRELASVIDRAAILGDGKGLEVAKALGVTVASSEGATSSLPPRPVADRPESAIVSLAEANRRHIKTALTATRGQIEGRRGAAAILEVNPHTLRAKMRKLGIVWARFREDTKA